MERSEVVSSAASGSDGLTQTENDDTLSETGSEEDTLNLVEGAILRTLKRYSSQQKRDGGSPEGRSENAGRVEEGTRRRGRFNNEEPHSADSVNGPAARSSTPEDKELLANLLEQVHSLRINQRHGSRKPKETLPTEVQDVHKSTRSSDRRRGKDKKSSSPSAEELRVTLEAAAMAAKAAADAAETALGSVARNAEAIDFIVKSMKSSKKRHKVKNATASEKREIVKSNRITHWILGFMAVTTIAWRLGVVKVVKEVTNKFDDPLKPIKKLVGGNDEEEDSEESSEEDNFFEKLSHVDLPSMLHSDSGDKDTKAEEEPVEPKEKPAEKENLFDKLSNLQNDYDRKQAKSVLDKKGNETKSFLAKSATTVDVKTKEAGKEVEKSAFSFANLFQVKPKEN